MRSKSLLASRVGTGAVMTLVVLLGAFSTASAQETFNACYVPEVGVLYMIGIEGLPAECLSENHVETSWTDGESVFVDGSVTTQKLADGAVTPPKLAPDVVMPPVGAILPFTGDPATLEGTGWVLCNAENNEIYGDMVPDLTGIFLRGGSGVGETGGQTVSTTTEDGSHVHPRRQISGSGFGDDNSDNQFATDFAGAHTHDVDVLPPYYVVRYIIRIQ